MENSLGSYLIDCRGKRTLRDIAKLTGLSHTYIRDLELGVNRKTGKPPIPSYETIAKLSQAYNVGINDIWRRMHPDIDNDDLFIEDDKKEKEDLIQRIKKILNFVTKDGQFFDFLKTDLEEIRLDFPSVTGKDFEFTYDSVKNLVEKNWQEIWCFDFIKEFSKMGRRRGLIPSNIRKGDNDNLPIKELISIIQQPAITYRSHPLTDDDRQRILDMLKLIFPDRG